MGVWAAGFKSHRPPSLSRRPSEACELTGGSYRREDVGKAGACRGSKVRLRHWERNHTIL